MSAASFLRCVYAAPAHREDEVAGLLWVAGSRGLQVRPDRHGSVLVDAWFPAEERGGCPVISGARLVEERQEEDRDWLAAWRRQAEPFALGRRFWIDPRDGVATPTAPPEGRVLLAVPARAAFGVGSHESTRLALELLEEARPSGRGLLDVGCGTGILALAGAVLGAWPVIGVDLDPVAAVAAHENASRNGLVAHFVAAGVEALKRPGRFDLLTANLLPDELSPVLPALIGQLAPAGRIVVSGCLREQAGAQLERLAEFDLAPASTRQEGEWVAWLLERVS